ncbi:MAG: PHP domain-containing protein [Deltaproteobacteria bacterium]|nr:PHP domain-containing protein [Deltaproteobacteria bacterium]
MDKKPDNIDSNGIDLHCHSVFSDGLLSPARLVDLAAANGISTLAITDHDTMAGVNEARQYGRARGILVVPGIEFSVCHNETNIHLLGYGLDASNANLKKLLAAIQVARVARNERIIEKLNVLGYKISIEQLPDTGCGQLGRPHIASLLVDKKIVHSEDEAFRRFLRRGAAAYVPRDIVAAHTAMDIITAAGGLAVLAHPGILGFSEARIDNLINGLYELGLHGIEVYHPANNKKMCLLLADICCAKKLLRTGGSDFHGRSRDKSSLGEYGGGRRIPSEIKTILKKL